MALIALATHLPVKQTTSLLGLKTIPRISKPASSADCKLNLTISDEHCDVYIAAIR